MVTTKGYDLTTSYQEVIPSDSFRLVFEVQNKTTDVVHLVVTDGTPSDDNSFTIEAGQSYHSLIPFQAPVHMRALSAGKVTILTNRQEV